MLALFLITGDRVPVKAGCMFGDAELLHSFFLTGVVTRCHLHINSNYMGVAPLALS